jgi:hypothetical protein
MDHRLKTATLALDELTSVAKLSINVEEGELPWPIFVKTAV